MGNTKKSGAGSPASTAKEKVEVILRDKNGVLRKESYPLEEAQSLISALSGGGESVTIREVRDGKETNYVYHPGNLNSGSPYLPLDIYFADVIEDKHDLTAKLILANHAVVLNVDYLLCPFFWDDPYGEFAEFLLGMDEGEMASRVTFLSGELGVRLEEPVRLDVFARAVLDYKGRTFSSLLDLEPDSHPYVGRFILGKGQFYGSIIFASEKGVEFQGQEYNRALPSFTVTVLPSYRPARKNDVFTEINGERVSVFDVEGIDRLMKANARHQGPDSVKYWIGLGDFRDPSLEVTDADTGFTASMKRLVYLFDLLLYPVHVDVEERLGLLEKCGVRPNIALRKGLNQLFNMEQSVRQAVVDSLREEYRQEYDQKLKKLEESNQKDRQEYEQKLEESRREYGQKLEESRREYDQKLEESRREYDQKIADLEREVQELKKGSGAV